MSVWDFIQKELLGMGWLNRLIGNGLEAVGLDVSTRVGGSIQFFLYDVIKIMVLLGVLILIISYIQSYFPPERTKKILGRFHGIGANCVAALLGTVTPFCSCSSIPLFMGFTGAGLPRRDLLLPYFLPNGGSRQLGASDEHLRMEGCRGLCRSRFGHRRAWRYADRKTPS